MVEQENKKELQSSQGDNRDKQINEIVQALVAGAHSLFIRPIKRKNYSIVRLPLMSEVNGKASRYFVLAELARHYSVNMTVVAYAIQKIHSDKLAYVDTQGVDANDVKGLQDCLEEAFFKRGYNGQATATLDTDAKVYLRDLQCPKPKTKGGHRPVVAPDWLIKGEALRAAQVTTSEVKELKAQATQVV